MLCEVADVNAVQTTSRPAPVGAFSRLGTFVARHRWPVLIAYLVAMALFGVFGVQVFGAMKSEGFNYPGSDSSRAAAILADEFGVTDPAAVLAIETPGLPGSRAMTGARAGRWSSPRTVRTPSGSARTSWRNSPASRATSWSTPSAGT